MGEGGGSRAGGAGLEGLLRMKDGDPDTFHRSPEAAGRQLLSTSICHLLLATCCLPPDNCHLIHVICCWLSRHLSPVTHQPTTNYCNQRQVIFHSTLLCQKPQAQHVPLPRVHVSPSLVREQFSSLLGLGPEGSRQLWEGRRRCRKKSLGGITEDRVDRIYKVVEESRPVAQVIEFLGLDRSLQEEGIFRKSATAR